jgi:hypothetical protein
MNLPPGAAQLVQVIHQDSHYAPDPPQDNTEYRFVPSAIM